MNKSLRQLFTEAQQTKLHEQEFTQGRSEVLSFVRNEIHDRYHPQRSKLERSNNPIKHFKPMNILIILALLIGGGASAAAEQSLPGDALYKVKVNVNEEVRSWLAVSDEAQAKWDAHVALRRLDEAEDLAADAELTAEARAQIEANFQAHADRVADRIAKFESEDSHAAADVALNFETSLKAHERILANIGDSQDASVKAQVDALLVKVRAEHKDSTSDRVREEGEVEVRADVSSSAEGRLNAAENKIEEVQRFIDRKEAQLGAAATVQAEARLAAAIALVADGKAKLDAKAYDEAFVLFGKAHATAQEAKLLVQAKVDFDDDGTPSPTPSATVSQSPSPSATVSPSTTVSPSPSAAGNSNRGRQIRIDLGL